MQRTSTIKTTVKTKKAYSPYEKFLRSIHTEATRTGYSYYLKQFLEYCGFNKYEQLLVNISTKKKEDLIRSYIQYLVQDRKLSYSTVNNTTAAIRLFYVANGVYLAFWESLKSIKGKNKLIIKNRTYTVDELKSLIEYADLREKVAVLVMLSSGIRVGALARLRVGDLKYNEEYKLYRIEAYNNEEDDTTANDMYITYCTPECATYINKYLEDRKKGGKETITKDSPLITHKIDSPTRDRKKNSYLSVKSIEKVLSRLRYDAKVIEPITMKELRRKVREQPNKRPSQFMRKEIMSTHAFRKFFDTACVDNNVNINIMKALMGHDIGLQKHYYKPENENKLLSEYLKIIDALTVDESYRLRRKTEKLEKQVEEINILKQQMKEKDQEWGNALQDAYYTSEELETMKKEFTKVVQESYDYQTYTEAELGFLRKQLEILKRQLKEKNKK